MIHTLHAEIDDALGQAKNSEEKAKRAMIDAARLSDELRAEQDHASSEERGKRALEGQTQDLESRLVDAEANAAKGGRAAMSKMESRIRELEMELGKIQAQTSESSKAFQRAERRVKELQFQQDEDKKNQDRMTELAQKLQQKIKTYKQQIEEGQGASVPAGRGQEEPGQDDRIGPEVAAEDQDLQATDRGGSRSFSSSRTRTRRTRTG